MISFSRVVLAVVFALACCSPLESFAADSLPAVSLPAVSTPAERCSRHWEKRDGFLFVDLNKETRIRSNGSEIAVRLSSGLGANEDQYVKLEPGSTVMIRGVRRFPNGDRPYEHTAIKLIAAKKDNRVVWAAKYYGDNPWDSSKEITIVNEGLGPNFECSNSESLQNLADKLEIPTNNHDQIKLLDLRSDSEDLVMERLGL